MEVVDEDNPAISGDNDCAAAAQHRHININFSGRLLRHLLQTEERMLMSMNLQNIEHVFSSH